MSPGHYRGNLQSTSQGRGRGQGYKGPPPGPTREQYFVYSQDEPHYERSYKRDYCGPSIPVRSAAARSINWAGKSHAFSYGDNWINNQFVEGEPADQFPGYSWRR
eukprot:4699-Ditylum_brightwellii.AAC.1